MKQAYFLAFLLMFLSMFLAWFLSNLKSPYREGIYHEEKRGFFKHNFSGRVKIIKLYFYGFIKYVIIINTDGSKLFKLYINNYFKKKYKRILQWKK